MVLTDASDGVKKPSFMHQAAQEATPLDLCKTEKLCFHSQNMLKYLLLLCRKSVSLQQNLILNKAGLECMKEEVEQRGTQKTCFGTQRPQLQWSPSLPTVHQGQMGWGCGTPRGSLIAAAPFGWHNVKANEICWRRSGCLPQMFTRLII